MAMDASLQNVGSTTTTTTTSELPKLISTNSFELNAGTSLSDDSGFALTNSSRFEVRPINEKLFIKLQNINNF